MTRDLGKNYDLKTFLYTNNYCFCIIINLKNCKKQKKKNNCLLKYLTL